MESEPLPRLRPLALAATLLGVASSTMAGPQASKAKDIYPEPAVAKAEIRAAVARAKREHKRVILDFGGNWCGDCRVLDRYFHQEPNASLLRANFVLVSVNIGKFDQNKDVVKTYGATLDKGVPALAVLDAEGKTLFSQKNGEFESMRSLQPSALTEFLDHWKG